MGSRPVATAAGDGCARLLWGRMVVHGKRSEGGTQVHTVEQHFKTEYT